MQLTDRFKRGDFVHMTAGDEAVDGMVTLASPCGKSLIVMFEAIFDGHVGQIALLWIDGGFVSLMSGRPVQIERTERAE